MWLIIGNSSALVLIMKDKDNKVYYVIIHTWSSVTTPGHEIWLNNVTHLFNRVIKFTNPSSQTKLAKRFREQKE